MIARRAALACLLLAGCAVGPDFHRPQPPAATAYVPAPLPGTPAKDGVPALRFALGRDIPAQWWALFHSPRLNALIARALAANPDIASARAALRQAHELTSAQRASLFPTVSGGFSATRAKNPSGALSSPTNYLNPYYSLYTAQLGVSYAADIFGGARRSLEATRAQEDSARYQLQATYLTLTSNVAVNALQAAALLEQIGQTRRLIAIQHDLTAKARAQRGLGVATELDMLSAQQSEQATVQTLAPLEKQYAQARDALAALVGGLPADETGPDLTLADLTLPADMPVSLPSSLVAQRPDILQAEANLHAATAQVGVAIADELPQISLSGSYGSTGLHPDQLFTPGFGFWSIGGNAAQTIFDAGALLHKRRAADAALDQAKSQYKSTVLSAFQNVADALRALQIDADATASAALSAQAAARALVLAQGQIGLGTISQASLLAAEQTDAQARLTLAQAQASRYADTVGLFQALGGGWWHSPLEAANESPGSAPR
jgi:NodT family efflux transporter outer membrane factor (OMF) lipoprotein